MAEREKINFDPERYGKKTKEIEDYLDKIEEEAQKLREKVFFLAQEKNFKKFEEVRDILKKAQEEIGKILED